MRLSPSRLAIGSRRYYRGVSSKPLTRKGMDPNNVDSRVRPSQALQDKATESVMPKGEMRSWSKESG